MYPFTKMNLIIVYYKHIHHKKPPTRYFVPFQFSHFSVKYYFEVCCIKKLRLKDFLCISLIHKGSKYKSQALYSRDLSRAYLPKSLSKATTLYFHELHWTPDYQLTNSLDFQPWHHGSRMLIDLCASMYSTIYS